MKCHFSQIIAILLSYCLHLAKSEFYTAIAELEKLLETEEKVVNSLETYLKIEEERLNKVKWLSKQYADLHNAASKDVETFLSNPVNAYLLVKRLSADWETTNQIVDSFESREVIQNITNEVKAFPNKEDLFGAAAALIRLQEIYLLDAATLARGQIKGTIPSTELTAGDCYELGKHAYSQMDWNHSLVWMQESLHRLASEGDLQPLKTANEADIYEYMAYAHFSLNNFTAAVELTQKILQADPDNPRAVGNLLFYQIRAADYELQKNEKGDTGHSIPVEFLLPNEGLDPAVIEAYERLCRGESLKTLEEESELYCYYTTNKNSYLLLQPVKVELLNYKPRIVVYHDVLKDWEASVLKHLSLPQLARATVNNGTSGKIEYASYRISKSTWLHDLQSPAIPKINKRIEDITGLDTAFSEALHVINYGIGGHYEPHFDFASPNEIVSFIPELGNRLATWIFYLSDVPAGGSTVFPTLGVEVKPVKGSAAFWYNVYKDGTVDENTRHAACPVLAGSKWVANKWLHEFGNEFRRPCGLSPYM